MVLSNFISYNRRLHSGAGTQWTEDDHELRDIRHTGCGRRHVFHLLHPPADHVPKSDHVVTRHLSQPLCPFWFPCRFSQTCRLDCLIFYRYEAHIIESGCNIIVNFACIYNFFFTFCDFFGLGLHVIGYGFNFYHLATQPTSHLCIFDSIVLR